VNLINHQQLNQREIKKMIRLLILKIMWELKGKSQKTK